MKKKLLYGYNTKRYGFVTVAMSVKGEIVMNKSFAFRLGFCITIVALILYTQICRIIFIPITWDEGLTYVFYVNRFFHSGDFIGGIIACLNGEIYCAANNHLLNTFLIGLAEKITNTRYNIAVIRFPIFAFWIIYAFACARQFLKKNISYLAFVMLMCCSYVNEFFALARGYGYSVAMIAIALFAYSDWLEDKNDRHIVWAFYALLIGEFANTATLLITATVALIFLIKIISEKNFLFYLQKLWRPVVIWIALQLVVVKYHFLITKYDLSIYNDRVGGLKSLIVNIITIPLTERTVSKPLQIFLIALVLLNIVVLVKKLKKVNDYPFFMMLIAFIGICFAMVQIIKNFSDQSGYPAGRALILIYPVCVLALDELLINCCTLLDKVKFEKALTYATVAVSILAFAFCMKTTNFKQSSDWPEAAACKKAAYAVYKAQGAKGMGYLEDISYNTDAFIYWQQKLLYEHGYDIFAQNN